MAAGPDRCLRNLAASALAYLQLSAHAVGSTDTACWRLLSVSSKVAGTGESLMCVTRQPIFTSFFSASMPGFKRLAVSGKLRLKSMPKGLFSNSTSCVPPSGSTKRSTTRFFKGSTVSSVIGPLSDFSASSSGERSSGLGGGAVPVATATSGFSEDVLDAQQLPAFPMARAATRGVVLSQRFAEQSQLQPAYIHRGLCHGAPSNKTSRRLRMALNIILIFGSLCGINTHNIERHSDHL